MTYWFNTGTKWQRVKIVTQCGPIARVEWKQTQGLFRRECKASDLVECSTYPTPTRAMCVASAKRELEMRQRVYAGIACKLTSEQKEAELAHQAEILKLLTVSP